MRRGIPLNEPVEGDQVIPTNNLGIPEHGRTFRVNSLNLEKIRKRAHENKAYVTALLFGHSSEFAEGEMGDIERKVVESEKIEAPEFVIPDIPTCSSSGMRKELFSHVETMETETGNDWARFTFKLFKGSYATTLLREFIKSETSSSY